MRFPMISRVSIVAFVAGSGGLIACGSSESTTGATSSSASTSASSSASSSATSSSSTSGGGGGGGSGGSGGGAPAPEWNALVVGTLANPDLAMSQAAHDAIAMGGKPGANMLGDFAHRVGLGTTLLGTAQNEFLALDRWHEDNLDKVYDDPNFQKAFLGLFSPPPSLEKLERNRVWATWGEVDAADKSAPHFYVVVRGKLKDPAGAQAIHDKAAMGGKDAGAMLGDVAHAVFLGRDDKTLAAFMDVWTSSTSIEMFYANPVFKDTFTALFEAPPQVGVYQSTTWFQW